MHLPLKIIRDSRTGGRERYEAAHILIRPDQFVVWAGSDAAVDATAVLRKAIGAG